MRWAWTAPAYDSIASAKPGLESPWQELFPDEPSRGDPPLLRGLREDERRKGVCVSWVPPAAWGRALDDKLDLPWLPDRWLVVRFARQTNGAAGDEVRMRAWIVDAGVETTENDDPASPRLLVETKSEPVRLGRVRTLKQAYEADSGGPPDTIHPLDVYGSRGSRDLTFAAFAPASMNNLGFVDDLEDILDTLDKTALSYLVVGWYRDPAKDPLRRSRQEGMADIKRALGLDAVERLEDKRFTEAQIREELGLPESAELKPPLPPRSMFHGMIAHVDYFHTSRYFGPMFGAPESIAVRGQSQMHYAQRTLGFGETVEDALAALLADITTDESERRSFERLLKGILNEQLGAIGEIGQDEILAQADRLSKYISHPAEVVWTVVPVEATKEDAAVVKLSETQRRLLDDLNRAQREADEKAWGVSSAAETLYAAWWARHGFEGRLTANRL